METLAFYTMKVTVNNCCLISCIFERKNSFPVVGLVLSYPPLDVKFFPCCPIGSWLRLPLSLLLECRYRWQQMCILETRGIMC